MTGSAVIEVTGAGSTAAPAAPGTRDSRLMASSLGLMLVGGASLAQLWLLTPHEPAPRPDALELMILTAATGGGVLLSSFGRRLPAGAFHLVVLGVLAVVLGARVSAGPAAAGFNLFFLWLTPWVFFFFSRPLAVAHTLALGAASAVVLGVEAGAPFAAFWSRGTVSVWLMLMGTTAAMGVLGTLARSLSCAVLDRERQQRAMVDASLTPTALLGHDGVLVQVNQAFADVLTSTPAALVGLPAAHLGLGDGAGEGPGPVGDRPLRRPDGTSVWVRLACLPVAWTRGGAGTLLQLQDLTAQRRAEEEAARLELARERAEDDLISRAVRQETLVDFARFALAADDLDAVLARVADVASATLAVGVVGVFVADPDGESLRLAAGHGWASGLVRRLRVAAGSGSHAGYALAHGTCVSTLATEGRFVAHAPLLSAGAVAGIACPVPARGGPWGTVNVYTDRPRVFTGEDVATLEMLTSIVAAAVDRHETEEEHRRHAVHDALTGLPNRTLFVDRLDMALDRTAAGREGELAVLLVDVDDFTTVNDSLGHAAGDELLLALAPRLRAAGGPAATVARVGGDAFAVLVADLAGDADVLGLAEQLTGAWRSPFEVSGSQLHVTASVGVAVLGRGRRTASELLQEADTAMHRAKEQGRGGVEMFDDAMRARAAARLDLEGAMRRDLARGRFEVAYQPVVRVGDGSWRGVEALARWCHEDRGAVAPDEFIPVAEASGLIVPLGALVLTTACTQVARWRRTLPEAADLTVNVNASARQLTDPGFLETVAATLRGSGLPPYALGLEITESVLVEDGPVVLSVLAALREMGVRILLDDFGTGYSSLSYLKAFPVDALKIDRSFVHGLGQDPDDTAIVTAIVTMAHSLGLAVVGEGVETDLQRRRLEEIGCDFGQGYYYARPLPPGELRSTLIAGTTG